MGLLDGKVALVTGAATGIGRAIFARADVSDESQIAALVRACVEAFGALHCASNNAARGAGSHPLTELRRESFERTLAVTLTGVWLCMKYEIPALIADGGVLVNPHTL